MVEPASSTGEPAVASFARGARLFTRGEPATALYLVEEGTVELTTDGPQGRLALLGPGDLVGELSVLESQPRECTAVATSDVRALQLDRDALVALLAASGEAAELMLRRLARRLHEARSATAQAASAVSNELPPAAAKPAGVGATRLVHEPTGTVFALPEGRVVVGRASRGQAPDIDLSPVDGERSLSRRHAALWREGDRYYVREEKDVANGTFLNGRRLKPGEAAALADGDKISFGLVRTVFHLS